MDKKKLLFFRWRYSDLCAEFVLKNKLLTERCLAPFFDVVSTDEDCDLAEMAERHEPDLIMFESGSGTLPFWRPKVTNVRACPDIPRIGLLESDPHSGSRSVFMADMDRLGIETFFTRATSMGEYFPEIADNLFIWPWQLDDDTCRDRQLEKDTVVTMTGACSPPYPWRQKIFPLLSERYRTVRSEHKGYLRSQATDMLWGEDYSRMLGRSLFSPCCGTAWKILVKKHFEIAGSGTCLVAEDTPILAAAGFRDMENCVLGDDRDIPAKMDALLEDRDRLKAVTRAGVDLLHSRHLAEHRPQIRQWLDLREQHGPDARLVQDGPFGDIRLSRDVNDRATPHLENFPEDRVFLKRGRELLRRGKHRPAAVMFGKMLDMAWHMPEANLGMAQCDLYAGRPDLAVNRLRITLKWCMKQYKCHVPNPVEWAWYIVALLCQGKRVKAAHLADQFRPGRKDRLRHREYEYARALVAILGNGECPEESQPHGQIPCIHESLHETRKEFLSTVADMLQACGRHRYAGTVRQALP